MSRLMVLEKCRDQETSFIFDARHTCFPSFQSLSHGSRCSRIQGSRDSRNDITLIHAGFVALGYACVRGQGLTKDHRSYFSPMLNPEPVYLVVRTVQLKSVVDSSTAYVIGRHV